VNKLKYSLRTKLSLSYALVALLLVMSISILSNFFMQKQFGEYVKKQQETKNKEIVSLITKQYNGETKSWDSGIIENLGVSALEQGLIVKLKDNNDTVIWDATVHNNGMCTQMITHMSQDMASRYPNFEGGYEEKSYLLENNSENIGSVAIGYYGPFYFTENDILFINTLNNMLVGVGIGSLIIALFLGTLMAKRISNPITRAIKAAEQISEGNFSDRVQCSSSTTEIHKLINTINNLAKTLQNQDMLRKRLTSDVAHELRTPLTTLQSHMEAMIDGVWEPERERLVSCHEEILRINRLVGDLEKLARFERENLLLNKTEFDIKELASKILNNFEADLKNNNIEASISGEPSIVIADSDKISQVIINLVSNALKYTPFGGHISIMIYADGQWDKIIVKDTGYGISEEDLPYIFERFYRADKSRNRITGGSGIGLAIVKAIVDAHNGKIHVTSKVGIGTEVTVELPTNFL